MNANQIIKQTYNGALPYLTKNSKKIKLLQHPTNTRAIGIAGCMVEENALTDLVDI